VNAADLGARARLDAAFAREERRGLMLAAVARSVAVVLIIGWTAVANPERGLAYAWVAGTASLFLLTGVAQFVCYRRRLGPALMPYVFVAVDCLVLAAVLIVPNPFAAVQLPPPMPFRHANFLFFFVLLMQVTFSFASLGALPLSLVPTFAVPLWTLMHVISLLQLRRASASP
jgi:adenylate cyclase